MSIPTRRSAAPLVGRLAASVVGCGIVPHMQAARSGVTLAVLVACACGAESGTSSNGTRSSARAVGTNDAQFISQSVPASATVGSYHFRWRMVQDGVAWFGNDTADLVISVVDDNAQYV